MICEYCLANKTSTKIRTSRDGDGMYYLCDDCTPANLNAQISQDGKSTADLQQVASMQRSGIEEKLEKLEKQ